MQKLISRFRYSEPTIRSNETITAKGILKATGRSIPGQMLIFICLKPNVLSIPASMEITVLIMKPIYRV